MWSISGMSCQLRLFSPNVSSTVPNPILSYRPISLPYRTLNCSNSFDTTYAAINPSFSTSLSISVFPRIAIMICEKPPSAAGIPFADRVYIPMSWNPNIPDTVLQCHEKRLVPPTDSSSVSGRSTRCTVSINPCALSSPVCAGPDDGAILTVSCRRFLVEMNRPPMHQLAHTRHILGSLDWGQERYVHITTRGPQLSDTR
jgi:hypothetical protein